MAKVGDEDADGFAAFLPSSESVAAAGSLSSSGKQGIEGPAAEERWMKNQVRYGAQEE